MQRYGKSVLAKAAFAVCLDVGNGGLLCTQRNTKTLPHTQEHYFTSLQGRVLMEAVPNGFDQVHIKRWA
jgi:hypothetical protein